MKKVSYIIILLVLLTTLLMGCSRNNELSIKICGYSDSIPQVSHELEFEVWSKDTFFASNVDKNIILTIGNIEVEGNYVESEIRFSEFYETHKYKDKNNCYFSLSDKGRLCTYFFGNEPSNSNYNKTYTELECIEIAKTFVSNITDVSEYTATATFDEGRKMYTVSFTKYADGFRCSDRADIMIKETGYIYSFSSTMLGQMSSNVTTSFDCESIEKQVISKLNGEYANAMQAYDEVSYESFDYELTIDDNGEYALICTVEVKCTHFYNDYDAVASERILLLIQ